MLFRAKCWEWQKCGREDGGSMKSQLGPCPAYPDNGRRCWSVAGTLCGGEASGTRARKIGDCHNCNWYRNVNSGMV